MRSPSAPTYEDVGPSPLVLGTGSYGMTKLMRHTSTSERYAVKMIERGGEITDHVRREIVNHRSLCHPFIVQVQEVFVTDTHLGVARASVGGGDLFHYVQQPRSFTEAPAS